MKHFALACAVVLLAFVPASLSAQADSEEDQRPVVIRADRMLDVETGQILQDPALVVEGGMITAVNPSSLPENPEEILLGNVTLLPGFIDAHTHLGGQIGAATFTDVVTTTESRGAYNAVKYGGITVRAGFTTVRDFGGDVTVELGKAVERGDIVAPHIVPSRNALGIRM